MLIYCIIIVLIITFLSTYRFYEQGSSNRRICSLFTFLRAFFMGLSCLYMINWLLSTFCLFVWRCLANLKKLGCNSARSTLGIPSGASGRCRSSQLPDVISFSRVSGEDKAATNGHQLGLNLKMQCLRKYAQSNKSQFGSSHKYVQIHFPTHLQQIKWFPHFMKLKIA